MKKDQLRMQMLAGIITESQYKEKINERFEDPFNDGKPDIDGYVVHYFNEDKPSRGINPDLEKHKAEIIQSIKDDFGDDYVLSDWAVGFIPKRIKELYKYYEKNKTNPEFQKRRKEEEIDKERYKNNLLPLTYSGSILDTPDLEYYSDSTTFYSYTDSYGNSRSKAAGGESRNYTLKPEYRNTPVDKATLDKHWHKAILLSLGIKK